MSQENVEIARRAFDAYSRRDVDALVAFATPDFEWVPGINSAFEGGSYRGREGIETWMRVTRDAWEEHHTIGAEFRDLGDCVVVLGRVEGRGRGSGARVGSPLGVVIDFRGGKVSRLRSYLDHGEALRAAGLVD